MGGRPQKIARRQSGAAVSGAAADTDAIFLKRLGQRVRKARTDEAISRKALAERSGVSERYLALLESGHGNASVLVLRQISAALQLPAEALLREADDARDELASVVQLLRGMTARQLARAQALLLDDLRSRPLERSKRIALVGLRGAGKSTLGQQLAASLQRPFIELDRDIERQAGTSLSEIFLLYGQQGYRRYERHCLEQLLNRREPCVIATGGSIVSEPATYNLLLATCYTVWIKARPEQHMERVIAQGDTRPMAGNARAMEDLRHILERRSDMYSRADAVVDTADCGVAESLAQLHKLIESAQRIDTPE